MIPNVIVQTSKYTPNKYRVEKLKEYAPGWRYEHFKDNDIISFFKNNPDSEFPDLENKFHSFISGPHKADLFRFYYLYKNGGVYIDTDCMLYSNINSIIKDYKFVSGETNPSQAFNGFICSEPNNVIIYNTLKYIYQIDISTLKNDYHAVCKEFMKIILTHKDDSVELLKEHFVEDGVSTIRNSLGQHKLSHFYKTKIIPITFLTRTIN